jgi:DNA-3-methyladenine glycosylase II
MATSRFTLNPTPPYDFTLSTWIFAAGDPQIRRSEDGRFWQVIRVGEKLVLAEVTGQGTTRNPALKVSLRSDAPLLPGESERAGEMISRVLNINDYLAPFYQAVKNDPPLHALTQSLRGLKPPSTPTVFEALLDSIIEQQISLTVARTLESRLTKMFGDSLLVEGKTYYAFPVPKGIASGKPEQFRACGLSAMKGEYIRAAAHQILTGEMDLEGLRAIRDPEEIIGELQKLKGVGRWTAEMVLLRGLHRQDIIPADDLGLRRVIARRVEASGSISGDEARKIADRWGPWKGLAAYYLLVADMLEK